MNVFGGADPGLSGALAFYSPDERRVVAMVDMPTLTLAKGKGTRREISEPTLLSLVRRDVVGLGLVVLTIAVERVSASPQMGVSSAFQFGMGYEVPRMLAAAMDWPVLYVTPAKWKREMAVPTQKDDARARACQLLPADAVLWTPRRGEVNKEQASGRAEAALLALYASQRVAPGMLDEKPRLVRRAS